MKINLINSLKSILSILIILTISACSNTNQSQPTQVKAESLTKETLTENPFQKYQVFYNPPISSYIYNVGNNESYVYEVTSISNNEIYGNPLNKISSDNAGIFLYENELDFNVQVGEIRYK